MCGGVKGWVGSGVWFNHGNCVCGVCVHSTHSTWCGLRIQLEVEIGCCVVGALVAARCVREYGCVRVYVFAEWYGCSVVLRLVLVVRCVRVIVYVMGC